MSDINISDATYRQVARYRAKALQKAGKDTMTLPTGITVDPKEVFGTRDYRGLRPPGADRTMTLHSPEKYLKDPRPGHRYVWRQRNDEITYGLVESHQLRPVSIDRIRRDVRGSERFFQYAGAPKPDGEPGYYAGSGTMALFEAGPAFVKENYTDPEDYDLSRLIAFQSKGDDNPIRQDIVEAGERYGIKVENVDVERTDVRTAEQEAARPIIK